MLNTPSAVLAVFVVVVAVNSFLFFGYYLPRMTTPLPPERTSERAPNSTTTAEQAQPTTTSVEQTRPGTTLDGTTTSTATATATTTPSP